MTATSLAAFGTRPYWATNSADGRYCFVSFAGDDLVSVISYKTEQEVARIPVGDHPQRMRMGKLQVGLLGVGAPSKAPCVDKRKFSYRLHRAGNARVVRVEVYVNGKLRKRRSGHDIRRVSIRRPPLRKYTVKIVTTHSGGGQVVSVRTYRGCTKGKPRTWHR